MSFTRALAPFTALAALAFAAPSARADERGGRIELGATVGAHMFGDSLGLGLTDTMDTGAPDDGGAYGLRLGAALNQRFGLEGELVFIPTTSRSSQGAMVIGTRGQGVLNLATGRVRPFLVAGLGSLGVVTERRSENSMQSDLDFTVHWGAGLAIELADSWDLRLDLRQIAAPSTDDLGATLDHELTAGFTFRFGAGAPPARPLPPAPAPEPPADSDGDGLVDTADRCPRAAEDMDKFEDADGCPDLDNDRDDIADKIDACPEQAEIDNGYRDDDGCPDELITELAGIQFVKASAVIASGSYPILVRAVQVLTEHPELQIEIAGHTSSEGPSRRNEWLSQQRAQAVAHYLIAQGIAPARLIVAGHGEAKPIADNDTETGRAANRRIEFHILPAAAASPR